MVGTAVVILNFNKIVLSISTFLKKKTSEEAACKAHVIKR